MPAYALRGVSVERGSNHALRDATLEIPADFVGSVIGPAGSGKSTLLRLLNRLMDPTQGTVEIDGEPIAEQPIASLRRRAALVFQGMDLFGLPVEENLRLLRPDASEQDLRGIMEVVGLDPSFRDRDSETLSAGERARVLLARALMGDPEMLLIDEVIANLDPNSARAAIAALQRVRGERGLAIVHVSHNMAHVRSLGGRCIALDAGRVAQVGPAEEVLESVEWTA